MHIVSTLNIVYFLICFQIHCDLLDLCKQYLPPEVSIIKEVEKLCRISSSQDGEQDESKEKRKDLQKDKMKRPFGKNLFQTVCNNSFKRLSLTLKINVLYKSYRSCYCYYAKPFTKNGLT